MSKSNLFLLLNETDGTMTAPKPIRPKPAAPKPKKSKPAAAAESKPTPATVAPAARKAPIVAEPLDGKPRAEPKSKEVRQQAKAERDELKAAKYTRTHDRQSGNGVGKEDKKGGGGKGNWGDIDSQIKEGIAEAQQMKQKQEKPAAEEKKEEKQPEKKEEKPVEKKEEAAEKKEAEKSAEKKESEPEKKKEEEEKKEEEKEKKDEPKEPEKKEIPVEQMLTLAEYLEKKSASKAIRATARKAEVAEEFRNSKPIVKAKLVREKGEEKVKKPLPKGSKRKETLDVSEVFDVKFPAEEKKPERRERREFRDDAPRRERREGGRRNEGKEGEAPRRRRPEQSDKPKDGAPRRVFTTKNVQVNAEVKVEAPKEAPKPKEAAAQPPVQPPAQAKPKPKARAEINMNLFPSL